jgi:hypothetical protein
MFTEPELLDHHRILDEDGDYPDWDFENEDGSYEVREGDENKFCKEYFTFEGT